MTTPSFRLLVLTAFVLLCGASLSAQEPSADLSSYSWRLDSLTYNYHPARAGARRTTESERVYYDYDADGFSETCPRIYFDPIKQLYFRINHSTYRYVYREFGENGKHTVYQYAYGDMDDDEQFMDSAATMEALTRPDAKRFMPLAKYEYAYDTYRNIFDEDGHLIRQIRNYDRIQYNWDEREQNWYPAARSEHTETDSTLFSKSYYFNTNEQQWKNTYRTYGRSYYRNHRLWKQEKMWEGEDNVESGTEYNENGGIVRTYYGSSTYGSETYYQSERIIGTASWTHPYDGYRIDTSELVKTTEMYLDDVFTRKTLTSKKRDEEYLIEKTPTGTKEYPQHVRTWSYNTQNELTTYSNSVYSYDAANHCTLRIDTTLNNGIWIAKRTEYNTEGNIIYSKKQEKRPAIDEWITLEETTPEYTLTTTVQWDASPINRWLVKKYRYGFGNRFRWDEVYNTESLQWECTYGSDLRLSLGENGEPLSSIEYEWKNYQWEPTYFYAFTYDTVLHAYAKNAVGYMSTGADGNIYSHNYKNGDITYYDAKGNEIGWYYSERKYGSWQVKQYDEYGRIVSNITYRTNENKELVDTTHYEQYIYFPNDSTSSVARWICRYKNIDTQTWRLGFSEQKSTKSYSTYSKEGILLQVATYGWQDDQLVLTQTVKHNDLTYDDQGRIHERITYRTFNSNYNVPDKRYVYFYADDTDPQWYACIEWDRYISDTQWGNEHVPTYQDYTRTDSQGRVIERITYTMNYEKTAVVPTFRYIYYYAGDAADWTTADKYSWNSTTSDWRCSGVSSHLPTRQAVLDDNDNVLSLTLQAGSCEQGLADAQQYSYLYGAPLSEEFVLSPAAYGLTEERVNTSNRPDFSPVAHRRVKQIRYNDLNDSEASYTVDYHYTQLRADVQDDEMPVQITPEQTAAVFTWGTVEGAQTYVLHVYTDAAQTEEICYVVFDQFGSVISIHFVRHLPEEQQDGFYYTMNDLQPGTTYWYTVMALDADGRNMESTYGSFRTRAADAPTALIQTEGNTDEAVKVIRNGKVFIRHRGNYYNLTGQRAQLPEEH